MALAPSLQRLVSFWIPPPPQPPPGHPLNRLVGSGGQGPGVFGTAGPPSAPTETTRWSLLDRGALRITGYGVRLGLACDS